MADFIQNGSITTLHNLRNRSVEDFEALLHEWGKERPMALVLPSLYSELEGPALDHIIDQLRHATYIRQIIIGLDQADERQFRHAREFFSRLPQEHRVLWHDGPNLTRVDTVLAEAGLAPPEPGKGRNVWYCMGYFLASDRCKSLALHDCDILTYDRELTGPALLSGRPPHLHLQVLQGLLLPCERRGKLQRAGVATAGDAAAAGASKQHGRSAPLHPNTSTAFATRSRESSRWSGTWCTRCASRATGVSRSASSPRRRRLFSDAEDLPGRHRRRLRPQASADLSPEDHVAGPRQDEHRTSATAFFRKLSIDRRGFQTRASFRTPQGRPTTARRSTWSSSTSSDADYNDLSLSTGTSRKSSPSRCSPRDSDTRRRGASSRTRSRLPSCRAGTGWSTAVPDIYEQIF